MPELVALDLPGGPSYVDALRAVWDTGDAACPLDPRLPPAAAAELLDALRPTKVLGSDGVLVNRDGGVPVESGDALVVATSGSTGAPRGVVLTHDAVRASAEATSARLGIDPDRHHWLAALPLVHIGGLSVITRALLTDTPVTVLPEFDAEAVNCCGREGSATHVSLVATALPRVDAGAFVTVVLGGSAPPGTRAENVVVTYGATETGSGVVYDRLPLAGVEVVSNPENGELLIRGPMLLRCYRDGSDPRVLGPDGSPGWYPTGDAGAVDGDGLVRVEGRLGERIRTGAETVWPTRLDACLVEHPGVAEIATWRRLDPEWGERVVVWIVPADPTAPPLLDALREFVRATLPAWYAPKEIVLVTELPRTTSGKVRRRTLH